MDFFGWGSAGIFPLSHSKPDIYSQTSVSRSAPLARSRAERAGGRFVGWGEDRVSSPKLGRASFGVLGAEEQVIVGRHCPKIWNMCRINVSEWNGAQMRSWEQFELYSCCKIEVDKFCVCLVGRTLCVAQSSTVECDQQRRSRNWEACSWPNSVLRGNSHMRIRNSNSVVCTHERQKKHGNCYWNVRKGLRAFAGANPEAWRSAMARYTTSDASLAQDPSKMGQPFF